MARNIVNAEVLADIFGVARATIANWRRQGMPCESPGKRGTPGQYDTVACIDWVINRRLGTPDALDLNEERARLAHHQADKTALEARVLKGELVRTLDVLEVWQSMAGAARAKLLAIPRKLAGTIVYAKTPAEAEKALSTAIAEALDELARSGLPRATERALESSGARLETAAALNS